MHYMEIPNMILIRQKLPSSRLENIEGILIQQLSDSGVIVRPGSKIAIAVGSRGIANIERIVRAAVQWVISQRGDPFIVPAMGSHGGATAEGQFAILESYGITEEQVCAPILSSMETVELPREDLEAKVYFDKLAYEADGTIVINRIKPHTDFHSTHESGLVKMIAVGLGKHEGALEVHRFGVYGLRDVMPRLAKQSLKHNNVIIGIGIVENAYDETFLIRTVPSHRIFDLDKEMLGIARTCMPSLPLDDIDILIVDEIGKDISGVGLDPNIIGRIRILGEPEPEKPRIKMIIIRDLTPASHGNATGMGLADVMTKQLYKKINIGITYQNIVTAGFLERAKMPIIAKTDREALRYAIRGCGPLNLFNARIMRIRNTLHIEELMVSPQVVEDLKERKDIEVFGPIDTLFDEEGKMVYF